MTPQHAVTNAAYLLFYRRRSDAPLGGPYFEKVMEECQRKDGSSQSSRTSSAAGDDQRFGDSSRAGSSNASQGHVLGPQGPDDLAGAGPQTAHEEDEKPPQYSSLYPENADNTTSNDDDKQIVLAGPAGSDRMDVDEKAETGYSSNVLGPFDRDPSWSFENTQRVTINPSMPVPPGSDEEDLMDGASDRAADGSSTNLSDRADRMADFADDDVDAADAMTDTADGPHPPPRAIQVLPGSSSPVAGFPRESSSPPAGPVQFTVTNEDVQNGDDEEQVTDIHVGRDDERSGEKVEEDRRDTGRMK
ncbi:MAG: CSN-associated deubiquitinating enzyme Ubp12 [Lichina confinis]|nr:MAG: CSN-associated deubiquitinating enzyme Ubp12 [Lichina confinis]